MTPRVLSAHFCDSAAFFNPEYIARHDETMET